MTSFIGPERSPRATRIPGCKQRTASCAPRDRRRVEPRLSTFDEEWREALASVLHSLATEAPDPDRTAACFQLLRHLNRVAAHH
jgi:hypothetical protein